MEDPSHLTNAELLKKLRELAARERTATADFMAHLGEADRRASAIIAKGYPSLFIFCTQDLKLAESTAYQRVKAARLARLRPEVLSYLRDGSLNLKSLSLIAPHAFEHPKLVEEAKGKSTRDVEALIAGLGEGRVITERVRFVPSLPAATRPPELFGDPPSASEETKRPAQPAPKASELRAEIRFGANEDFLKALERLKALLWHKYPSGRFEDVLFEAVRDYLDRKDPAKDRRPVAAAVPPTDSRSRRIPAAVQRLVWRRDGSRCTMEGCGETLGLEIDHIQPWAHGGASDDPTNLRLLCAAHNQSERRRIFGDCARAQSVDNSP